MRVIRSRSSPEGCSPGRTPTECASWRVRCNSAASKSIRAGSADHTASAVTTMSSEVAYNSFMRSTSSASEKRSLSLPVPAIVGAAAVADALPATVTLSPRSSSVSSTRSSRFDQRLRERISRAERNASAYASKYAHSREIDASAAPQRSLVVPVSSAPSRSLRPAWSCRARSEVSMASCSAPSRASARSTSSRSITGPEGPVTPIDHPSFRGACGACFVSMKNYWNTPATCTGPRAVRRPCRASRRARCRTTSASRPCGSPPGSG